MAYDVFISYRRETGADDARLLQQALKARGYNVFFDYDSLRDGKFDEKIFEAIDEAPVFVLLLTERALDRCVNADDWVRLEIERAIAKGKKIISVAPSDQKWDFPENLPGSLGVVKAQQASELNKASLFEESINKMIDERFPLQLKRKKLHETESAGSKPMGNAPKPKKEGNPPISLWWKVWLWRHILIVKNHRSGPIIIDLSVRNGRRHKVFKRAIDGKSEAAFRKKDGWPFGPGDQGEIKVAGWDKTIRFTIDENGDVTTR